MTTLKSDVMPMLETQTLSLRSWKSHWEAKAQASAFNGNNKFWIYYPAGIEDTYSNREEWARMIYCWCKTNNFRAYWKKLDNSDNHAHLITISQGYK